MRSCNQEIARQFDYSNLKPEFAKLSKPAKRALINNRIFGAADLTKWSERDVMRLHGIGPSALPVLKAALRSQGLGFAE